MESMILLVPPPMSVPILKWGPGTRSLRHGIQHPLTTAIYLSPRFTPVMVVSQSRKLGRMCDEILTTESFASTSKSPFNNPTWPTCTDDILHWIKSLILSCKPNAANCILEKLFQVPEFRVKPQGQELLEVFWNCFPGRPKNTLWPQWDKKRLLEEKLPFDPEHIEFLRGGRM
jgi:hypothetical protein